MNIDLPKLAKVGYLITIELASGGVVHGVVTSITPDSVTIETESKIHIRYFLYEIANIQNTGIYRTPNPNDGEDLVNHPPHYKTKKGLETIDVIEAFTEDLVGIEATDTGNIIKYICRWKHKNGLQDLKKAKWYLEHLINHVEKENGDG